MTRLRANAFRTLAALAAGAWLLLLAGPAAGRGQALDRLHAPSDPRAAAQVDEEVGRDEGRGDQAHPDLLRGVRREAHRELPGEVPGVRHHLAQRRLGPALGRLHGAGGGREDPRRDGPQGARRPGDAVEAAGRQAGCDRDPVQRDAGGLLLPEGPHRRGGVSEDLGGPRPRLPEAAEGGEGQVGLRGRAQVPAHVVHPPLVALDERLRPLLAVQRAGQRRPREERLEEHARRQVRPRGDRVLVGQHQRAQDLAPGARQLHADGVGRDLHGRRVVHDDERHPAVRQVQRSRRVQGRREGGDGEVPAGSRARPRRGWPGARPGSGPSRRRTRRSRRSSPRSS